MGRYYTGDIEGKFWFGVQSSYAPENIGGELMRVTFQFADKRVVDFHIQRLNNQLGDNVAKLDKYFKENPCYNDEDLAKYLEIKTDEVKGILKDYADLELARQVSEYLQTADYCEIDCEL